MDALPTALCKRCGKPRVLCICDEIAPIDNRVALLILQHPQEQDRELGTARLATLLLKRATLTIGLSWPSLAKALGRPAEARRWAVLYLGSRKPPASAKSASRAAAPAPREVIAVDAKGTPLDDQRRALAGLDGVVVLDGTWSQAKTLWWRNPWLLKCRRLVLNPARPSLYGKLRREPRREGLATLEAAGLALAQIEERPEIETTLLAGFALLLERYRALARQA